MDRYDDRTPLWDYSDNRYPDGGEYSGRWNRARAEDAARAYVASEEDDNAKRDRYGAQRPRGRYRQQSGGYDGNQTRDMHSQRHGGYNYGGTNAYNRYDDSAIRDDSRGRYERSSGYGWPSELGYPPSSAYTSYGDQRYRSDQDDQRRGFFERAGDEVLSWFGDSEAQQRREQDHRGRGPKNYARSDERIREDVNDRLTEDVWLDASEIDVSVAEGEVSLIGTVEDRRAKRRAEDIADGVSGVKHVQNNLRYTSGVVSPKID